MDYGDQPIFKNDPLNLYNSLDKYVKVESKDGKFYQGFVYTIDPVTESIILSTPTEGRHQIKLIMGHCVRSITEIESSDSMKPIPRIKPDSVDSEFITNRKVELMTWLSKNLLPINENDGVIEVHNGALSILPPYRKQDCISDNSIILGRIQHLLQNMPLK